MGEEPHRGRGLVLPGMAPPAGPPGQAAPSGCHRRAGTVPCPPCPVCVPVCPVRVLCVAMSCVPVCPVCPCPPVCVPTCPLCVHVLSVPLVPCVSSRALCLSAVSPCVLCASVSSVFPHGGQCHLPRTWPLPEMLPPLRATMNLPGHRCVPRAVTVGPGTSPPSVPKCAIPGDASRCHPVPAPSGPPPNLGGVPSALHVPRVPSAPRSSRGHLGTPRVAQCSQCVPVTPSSSRSPLGRRVAARWCR